MKFPKPVPSQGVYTQMSKAKANTCFVPDSPLHIQGEGILTQVHKHRNKQGLTACIHADVKSPGTHLMFCAWLTVAGPAGVEIWATLPAPPAQMAVIKLCIISFLFFSFLLFTLKPFSITHHDIVPFDDAMAYAAGMYNVYILLKH